MCTLVAEALQFAVLGPDFKSLSELLDDLTKTLTVDLNKIISFRNGTYWLALDMTFGIIAVWVFLNAAACLCLGEKALNCCVMRLIEELSLVSLPLLGNVCFVPIVSILIDVFICDQAVGYGSLSYGDSILAKDCYAQCWDMTHALYVLFASLSLAIYVPSAILLRPIWHDYQNSLHIKTFPLFQVVKSVVQVTLICLNKTLKHWHPTVYAILFLCILTVFLTCSILIKAYNYSRVNLWQRLSLVGVGILALIALLNDTVYRSSDFKLVILVVILWFFLISTSHTVFGVIFQQVFLPSLLYRKKGRDFSKILRFAFTNQVPASEIQPQLNLVRLSEEFTSSTSEATQVARRFPTVPITNNT
jgi:hypothetical protein